MYCRICGEKLADDAKFCHKCGTEVYGFSREIPAKETAEKKEEFNIEAPKEAFQWNVHTFPGNLPKKTDNTDFDWGVEEEFKNQQQAMSEIALAKEPTEPEIPDFLKSQEPILDLETLERQRAAELEEEKIREEAEAEAARLRQQAAEAANIQGEKELEKTLESPEVKVETPAYLKPSSIAKAHVEEEEPVKETVLIEPKQPKAEPVVEVVQEKQEEAIKEPEVIIEGAALEKELFAEEGTKAQDHTGTPIDKFYTFNEKNEEFQKLLDQEYEKFASGKTASKEEFHANIEDIKRRTLSNLPILGNVEEESMLSEMIEARAHFFDDDIEEEQAPVETEAPAKEEAAPSIDAPVETDEKKQEWKNTDFFDEKKEIEEPKKEKSGKGSKVAIIILSIVLAVLVILLGVKFIAPNSALSQKLDQVVTNFLGGTEEDTTPQAVNTDRSVAQEDKTGLIQMQLDKNTNNNIGLIRYNQELAYSSEADYSNEDIKKSTSVSDNILGTDKEKKIYVDESAVGAAIAYASKEPMEVLEVGELRQDKATYYLWVAESNSGVKNKIYELEKKENGLEFVKTYDL